MSIRGTASYDGVEDLPDEVSRAVHLARDLGFENSCRLEQGRLLQILAAGRRGGVIGETGTGCGVGLSWMVSGAGSDTRLLSVEREESLARSCRHLFGHLDNVHIDHGDWRTLLAHAPFDLLVLDGGGSGKGDAPVDVREALRVGGTVVIDDFTPFADWPPTYRGAPDEARRYWFDHPNLLATEIRLSSDLSTILATRIT